MIKALYPLHYVCLFAPDIPEDEGGGIVFLAKDIYSGFVYMTGVERVREKEKILKHVKLLVEHAEFVNQRNKPFVLVLHKYEELREDIENIIKPYGGSMMVDSTWVIKEFTRVMEDLFKKSSTPGKNLTTNQTTISLR